MDGMRFAVYTAPEESSDTLRTNLNMSIDYVRIPEGCDAEEVHARSIDILKKLEEVVEAIRNELDVNESAGYYPDELWVERMANHNQRGRWD